MEMNNPIQTMTQDEYEALPEWKKVILTCNEPGCGKPVCNQYCFCVEHRIEVNKWLEDNGIFKKFKI